MQGSQKPRRCGGTEIQRVLESTTFKALALGTLTFALFGGGLGIVLDLPDEPTTRVMDVLMCTATAFFVAEVLLRAAAEPHAYPLSGFFFMDVVGTVSMAFEISFLLGQAGQMDVADSGVNAVLLRSARAARMSARIGRLSKLVRCIDLFTSRRREREEGVGQQALLLSRKISAVLSTKVALLTVVLVLGVPLFSIGQYPQADLSMRAWSRRLEADYCRTAADLAAGNRSSPPAANPFLSSVEELLAFYGALDYSPYLLEGFPERLAVRGAPVAVRGAALVRGEAPRRLESVLRQPVQACGLVRAGCEGGARAAVYFDLTPAKRYNAAMDLAIIAFVVVAMAWEAHDLSQTLRHMVVRPVERLLDTVYSMNQVIHQAVAEGPGGAGGAARGAGDSTETAVVERALKKLGRLMDVFLAEDLLDCSGFDPESRGVVVEVLQLGGRVLRRPSSRSAAPPPGRAQVERLPAAPALIASWELDVLGMEPADQDRVVCHVLLDSEVGQQAGRAASAELPTLRRFVEAARAGYRENPYHCYAHACDVVAGCARLLQRVQWHCFLGEVEAYALLLSALCHDIGHPGRTNPFLVETGDALALRYNDRSPLENMHCARLFDLCREPERDVLRGLSREQYRQARAVCIASILHTDNAQHFDLVRELKKAFEVGAEACGAQALDPERLAEPYLSEVLCRNTSLWHRLFLHLADISNPLKPFWVYMLWAARVADEFFAQGDEEKRLGMPVGMLNDRDKVSRPGAEHGFITFLVAPLVASTVSLFPVLGSLACQMASNLESWRNLWVQQAEPSPEDIQKRDADVGRIREQVELLNARCPRPAKTL